MNNVHPNVHENQNNVQPHERYQSFDMHIILTPFLLSILFALKHLNLSGSSIISDDFVHNPRKGNRMLVGRQNHSTPIIRAHGTKAALQSAHFYKIYLLGSPKMIKHALLFRIIFKILFYPFAGGAIIAKVA